ncbi:hypothetical protein GW17_00015825 [Ensete ventricosum]|nr:hypothetical protein GW17_00015825 [Ensete ventricosum]
MLRSSVTREWVGEGELPRERTKIGDGEGSTMCWQRPHMERLRAMVNAMVPQRRIFRVCVSNLASDESLGYQHMGAVYHRVRILSASTRESHGRDSIIQRYDRSDRRVGLLQCLYSLKGARQVRGQGRNTEVLKRVIERGEEATTSPEGLSYPKAKCRLERRWTRRSAAEADLPSAKKRMHMQGNG